MMRPTLDQMFAAAEWLDAYDPDAAEFAAMTAVAAWLRDQAGAAEIRAACRANKVPVRVVRDLMKQKKAAA